MPPASKPALPEAACPRFAASWDPWNTTGTGHQRPEYQQSAAPGWRNSRNQKLHSQLMAGSTGGRRMYDLVGAGAENWDRSMNAVVPRSVRERKGKSVADMLAKPGLMRAASLAATAVSLPTASTEDDDDAAALWPTNKNSADLFSKHVGEDLRSDGLEPGIRMNGITKRGQLRMKDEGEPRGKLTHRPKQDGDDDKSKAMQLDPKSDNQKKKLFDGLTIFVNGSTLPLVSDHKLRKILTEHGANMSMHLGRRKVTHVILGRPVSGGGAGGGLAGAKLNKEIVKLRGCGLKFTSVEWVLDSLKAGKRLPEARYAGTKIAVESQGSVHGLFSKSL